MELGLTQASTVNDGPMAGRLAIENAPAPFNWAVEVLGGVGAVDLNETLPTWVRCRLLPLMSLVAGCPVWPKG